MLGIVHTALACDHYHVERKHKVCIQKKKNPQIVFFRCMVVRGEINARLIFESLSKLRKF